MLKIMRQLKSVSFAVVISGLVLSPQSANAYGDMYGMFPNSGMYAMHGENVNYVPVFYSMLGVPGFGVGMIGSHPISGMYPMYGDQNYMPVLYSMLGVPLVSMQGMAGMFGGMLPMSGGMETMYSVPKFNYVPILYSMLGLPFNSMSMAPSYTISGMYPMHGDPNYVPVFYSMFGIPFSGMVGMVPMYEGMMGMSPMYVGMGGILPRH